ncbi:unnamed protein product [Coccothraustes coccothraustes]
MAASAQGEEEAVRGRLPAATEVPSLGEMFKRSHCKLAHQNDSSLKVILFWTVMAKLEACVVSSVVSRSTDVTKEATTKGLKEVPT